MRIEIARISSGNELHVVMAYDYTEFFGTIYIEPGTELTCAKVRFVSEFWELSSWIPHKVPLIGWNLIENIIMAMRRSALEHVKNNLKNETITDEESA